MSSLPSHDNNNEPQYDPLGNSPVSQNGSDEQQQLTWEVNARYIYEHLLIKEESDVINVACQFLRGDDRDVLCCGLRVGEREQLVLRSLKMVPAQNFPRGSSELSYELSDIRRFSHPGEINELKCAQQTGLGASYSSDGNVYIFDLELSDDSSNSIELRQPRICLKGNLSEGCALAWNSVKSDLIAVGSNDHRASVWSIERQDDALFVIENHLGPVGEVVWRDQNELLTACDDSMIRLWDLRAKPTLPMMCFKWRPNRELNALAKNDFHEFVLAAGGADPTIILYDLRTEGKELYCFDSGHQGGVTHLQFHPHRDSVIASGGDDSKIRLFDFARIGQDTFRGNASDDSDEGTVEELFFTHSPHPQSICDMSFYDDRERVALASCAADCQLHVWQVLGELVSPLDVGDSLSSDDSTSGVDGPEEEAVGRAE